MRKVFALVLGLLGCTPPRMTHLDPSDPQSWIEAKALAEWQGVGDVHRRSKHLPFVFMADHARCVLVHKGHVVVERDLQTVTSYFADLGLAQGSGPPVRDLLFVLWAFHALPDVSPIHEEGYVEVEDDRRLAPLTARVESDGTAARIVLHYFEPEDDHPSGAVVGSRMGPLVRKLQRATLEIRPGSTPAWKIEPVTWTDPG